MSKWASIAKTHFLQKGVADTPKTPETLLMGVLGVVPRHIFKNEPFNDDGLLTRLIAAAMLVCNHYGDNEARREEMRQDILNTPPELRQDLLDHFNQSKNGAVV